MEVKQHPRQETLREYFEYVDGNFIRLISLYRGRKGEIVKTFKNNRGWYHMAFKYERYQYHRIVWIYHYGDIPDGYVVDHIDCDPANNRIENLRLATISQNSHNQRYQGNNSGHKDITKYYKIKRGITYWYYLVGVKLNGKAKRKNFPFTEDGLLKAIEYRDHLINQFHGEFGRLV